MTCISSDRKKLHPLKSLSVVYSRNEVAVAMGIFLPPLISQLAEIVHGDNCEC